MHATKFHFNFATCRLVGTKGDSDRFAQVHARIIATSQTCSDNDRAELHHRVFSCLVLKQDVRQKHWMTYPSLLFGIRQCGISARAQFIKQAFWQLNRGSIVRENLVVIVGGDNTLLWDTSCDVFCVFHCAQVNPERLSVITGRINVLKLYCKCLKRERRWGLIVRAVLWRLKGEQVLKKLQAFEHSA